MFGDYTLQPQAHACRDLFHYTVKTDSQNRKIFTIEGSLFNNFKVSDNDCEFGEVKIIIPESNEFKEDSLSRIALLISESHIVNLDSFPNTLNMQEDDRELCEAHRLKILTAESDTLDKIVKLFKESTELDEKTFKGLKELKTQLNHRSNLLGGVVGTLIGLEAVCLLTFMKPRLRGSLMLAVKAITLGASAYYGAKLFREKTIKAQDAIERVLPRPPYTAKRIGAISLAIVHDERNTETINESLKIIDATSDKYKKRMGGFHPV